MADFGECVCGGRLTPVWFTEEEIETVCGIMLHTGRKRRAVSHLTCEDCLRNYPVDDTFDGAWR